MSTDITPFLFSLPQLIKNMEGKAVLLLEDGTFFEGKAAGHIGTSGGEICFNTGMTGYQEIFTDPSYYGQVLVSTNAHIGNYGTLEAEDQSEKVQISALVCKNFNHDFSRPVGDSSLQAYFEKHKIVCIYDIDTREIVRHIRGKGAMNCIISSEIFDKNQLKKRLTDIPDMSGLELASEVSTKIPYTLGDRYSDIKIAVLDYGAKRNILQCLVDRGVYLKVFPAKTSLEVLNEFNPDGFFLSNGPGDPAAMDYAIETAKKIIATGKPVFGICLGHQLIALAHDIPTYKMHHGHRGINHPVKNVVTGLCEVTSQNHGFGVSPEAIHANLDKVEITHVNLNDDTIEGIKIQGKDVFSVQYHPEAAPGPHDSRYLFDQFISNIKAYKNDNH